MSVLDKSRNTSQRLRRQLDEAGYHPLTARSLLLSLLLGAHPPELHVSYLIAFGEHFGHRAGTIRTALSRMAAADELTAHDGRYRLAGRMIERQRQQDAGQTPPPDDWDQTWWTAIVSASDRTATERRHFRSAMVGDRMGELRPDIWMRPANVAGPSERNGIIVTRGSLVAGDAIVLANRLWDTASLDAEAGRWLDALAELDPLLDGEPADVLPLAFDVSAMVVRYLRTEPQLPIELAPMPSSRALRAEYGPFNQRFLAALDRWLTPGVTSGQRDGAAERHSLRS